MKVQEIVELQVRLILGSIGMWLMSWIFVFSVDTQVITYTLTNVIPVLLGYQVVLLVSVAFAYPRQWAETMWNIVGAILELSPPMIDAKDLIQKVRKLLLRVASNGSKVEYVVMQFDELCDVSDVILGNGHRSPVEELNFKFRRETLEEMRESNIKTEMGTMDGRPHEYPVVVAETY